MQHEDDEGYIYFYDAVLDKSSWEHPMEAYWKRVLNEERRKIQRSRELTDLQQKVAAGIEAGGQEVEEMVREMKAKYLKNDIAEMEAQIEGIRSCSCSCSCSCPQTLSPFCLANPPSLRFVA